LSQRGALLLVAYVLLGRDIVERTLRLVEREHWYVYLAKAGFIRASVVIARRIGLTSAPVIVVAAR